LDYSPSVSPLTQPALSPTSCSPPIENFIQNLVKSTSKHQHTINTAVHSHIYNVPQSLVKSAINVESKCQIIEANSQPKLNVYDSLKLCDSQLVSEDLSVPKCKKSDDNKCASSSFDELKCSVCFKQFETVELFEVRDLIN
jgi:hypothetical protein